MPNKRFLAIIDRVLPKGKFARSVSLLAGGAAAGQIIVVAASPVLARLYSPEDFGLLAVFSSLLGLLGVIASLRYQLAIPLPKNEVEAVAITVLSFIVVFAVSALVAVLVLPLRHSIAGIFNTPVLAGYIWMLPLGLLLTGMYEVFNYWAIRKKAFGSIAQTKFTQSCAMVCCQVGGYTFGPLALILGRIIGQAVGICRLSSVLLKQRQAFTNFRRENILSVFKRYKSFPLVSSWSALASAGGGQLPALLIAMIMGVGSAGLYALTSRVMALPIGVISKSMGDVFYTEAIEAKQRGALGYLVVDIYSKMIYVGMPLAFVLSVSSPVAFVLIFGESWALAGELAKWLTCSIFFQFVTTPPGRVFLILERHGYALSFQLAFLLVTVLSIVIGGVLFSDLVAMIVLLTLGRSAIYCLRFWKILHLVGEGSLNVWRPLLKGLPYSVLCALPASFAGNIKEETFVDLLCQFGLITISVGMALVPSYRLYRIKGRLE